MSNSRNRELEKKYLVLVEPRQAKKLLTAILPQKQLRELRLCSTEDSYWDVPGQAQFMRVRESYGKSNIEGDCKLLEVTTKCKDKGSNLDRLELNVGVDDAKKMEKLLELCFKQPAKKLKKLDEVIWFLKDGTVFSLSLVNGKPYLEVEARSKRLFQKYVRLVEETFKDTLRYEPKSFFELYIAQAAKA